MPLMKAEQLISKIRKIRQIRYPGLFSSFLPTAAFHQRVAAERY
jgi:hypothetical protein